MRLCAVLLSFHQEKCSENTPWQSAQQNSIPYSKIMLHEGDGDIRGFTLKNEFSF